jgi:hypothetical protein
LFVYHEIAALFAVIFEEARLDDGVDRAGFLTETAVDALREIDVVAGGAPRAVVALLRLDGDGHGRAYRLAELAGDAAFFAVRVTAQGMVAAEAGRQGGFLLGILDRDLAVEEPATGEAQALEELGEQEALEVSGGCGHGALLYHARPFFDPLIPTLPRNRHPSESWGPVRHRKTAMDSSFRWNDERGSKGGDL